MTAIQSGESPHDQPATGKVTEDLMLRSLWRHFYSNGWAFVSQVTISLGDLNPAAVSLDIDALDRINNGTDRRIDALMARRSRNPLRTGALETMAIEVKVTKADYQADMRAPEKQEPWRKAATRHAYAVPAGLIQAQDVPEQSGLLWVTPPSHPTGMPDVRWVRKAPYLTDHKPKLPFRVLLALLYRGSAQEAATRGWNFSEAAAGSEDEVRAALVAANRKLVVAERSNESLSLKASAWQKAYALAAPDGLPCAFCGKGIKPHFPRRDWFRGWKHMSKADDEPCELTQVTAAESAARAAYAAATPQEIEKALRFAHRLTFNEYVEREPWRAFIDALQIDYSIKGGFYGVKAEPPYPAPAFPGESI